ncbi:MAG: hypothetical protein ACYS0E_01150 [Planctomycetota bacterium]
MISVDCEHCFKPFEVQDSLAGGLANCPACGKATAVPGLRDPWFRLVQAGMVVGWAGATAVGWSEGGPLGAVLVGCVVGLILGVIYAAM